MKRTTVVTDSCEPSECELIGKADHVLESLGSRQFYVEVKSPVPNKGQGIEVTERLLRTHAILGKGPPKVNTFFAMAYNPYGTRQNYKHSFAIKHLDIRNQVVLQDEFWDIVAGPGTFAALLEIYREVGLEKGPQILKRLGYDF